MVRCILKMINFRVLLLSPPWLATILQIEMHESLDAITKAHGLAQVFEEDVRLREELMITHLYRYIEAEGRRVTTFDGFEF